MLTAIHIQDFLLVRQASLPLAQGLTALTGETGAGKSILLDALGLAAGARFARGGGGSAVRQGAKQGVVSAVFEPTAEHEVWAILEENAIDAEDDQIILKRLQLENGKTRAFINDCPVSVALLRKVGGALLEVHGQHDGQGFLSAATHRDMLDAFGGLSGDGMRLGDLWRQWRAAQDALDARQAMLDKNASEADYLRHIVSELESLNPQEDEEEGLAARRTELMASEKAREELDLAVRALSEDGLEGSLTASARRLMRASEAFDGEHSAITNAVSRIDAALSEIMEARSAVGDAARALDFDADELENVEERLFALRAAARKHGISVARLPEALKNARAALDDIDQGAADLSVLQKTVDVAFAAYEKAGLALSKARRSAASRLDQAVAHELAPLKLDKAQFFTDITTEAGEPTATGFDAVEFMVATNPGAPPGPLKAIASGGELSRFVLAMKAALAAKESRTVIIFDEVDAGVGGAVADAVGARLARLAMDAQVLVVTHSPQVAARADWHWRVSKDQSGAQTKTSVASLDAPGRVEEIARMLSGADITDEARAAAIKLLAAPSSPSEPVMGEKKSAKRGALKKTGSKQRGQNKLASKQAALKQDKTPAQTKANAPTQTKAKAPQKTKAARKNADAKQAQADKVPRAKSA